MTRVDRLRGQMHRDGVDLVALGPGAHMEWLLGVRPHADERPLLACVTQSGVGFLMPSLEAQSARLQTDLPFYEWADEEGADAAFARLLADLGAENARSIVFDETMRADFAALVQDHLPKARRQFCEKTVGALRMRKDAAEYDALKRNAKSAYAAMEAAWSAMAVGMSETEVAQVAREHFLAQGTAPLFSIVGTGGEMAPFLTTTPDKRGSKQATPL